MSESAFKVGDFVERQYVRYQVIAINFEGNPVCFDKTREIPHTFHRSGCRLIPGCESFDQRFPSPVPDCEAGWRLLRKGWDPELVIKGDQFCMGNGPWVDSCNWQKYHGGQDFGLWYRRRVEPAVDLPSEQLKAIRAAGKIVRDAGIANVADALSDHQPDPFNPPKWNTGQQWSQQFVIGDRVIRYGPGAQAWMDAIASCKKNVEVFSGITLPPGTQIVFGPVSDHPTWHAGVGVDVVAREASE